MKHIKIVFAVILILSVPLAGSCASAKNSTPSRTQSKKTPKHAQPEPEFNYEFDVLVEVDPEKQQAPRPDYEEEKKRNAQSQLPEPIQEPQLWTQAGADSASETAAEAQRQALLERQALSEQQEKQAQQQALLEQQERQAQQQALSDQQEKRQTPGVSQFPSSGGESRGAAGRNTDLVASGSVNSKGVVNYIKVKSRNPVLSEASIERLVNLYIDEAVKEDVNYDFAIAQMLYWTAFFTDKQRVETNNYAGLQPTREWNGKFPTMAEGVRAHIQHLRGYSHPTLKDTNTKIVDPRWSQISNFRGSVKNFDQLYPKWTQNTERYRKNITMILDDMYQYSDKIR